VRYTWRVGIRYLKPRNRHFLISVLTSIALLGVMVAVAAPQLTLSVMNGFESEVRQRIVNTNYNVFVMSRTEFNDYETVAQDLAALPEVIGVSPFIRREGMLSFSGGGTLAQSFHPCVVYGVDPQREQETTRVLQSVAPEFIGFDSDLFDVDGQHHAGIVLGVELGKELRLSLGDAVTLAVPLGRDALQDVDDLRTVEITQRSFRVTGFLNSGFYEFDAQLAFIDFATAQEFLASPGVVNGLGLRVADIYAAGVVAERISDMLGPRFYTNNWIQMFRNVFTWMETERKLMALLFLLIISIAVITVVGMLTMIVMEKRKAIGILKSLGAPRTGIMAIFIIHGTLIGAAGAVLGSLLGYGVCRFVDQVGIDLPGDVYIINTLPVQTNLLDFLMIGIAAIVLCFLATLYPSWEAARLDPIEAIRYE
jgi:lipoprotein-releasing system permease protein